MRTSSSALALILAACGLLSQTLTAEIVVLRDGTRYEGKCSIAGKEIAVSRAITTSYVPRALVIRIELTPEEQAELNELTRRPYTFASHYYRVAKWLDDHLQFERAVEYYNLSIGDNPDYQLSRDALGYRRSGGKWQPDPSRQLARASLYFGDAGAKECVRLARAYADGKQPQNAEKALRAALAAGPGNAEALQLIQPYLATAKRQNVFLPPLDGKTIVASGHNHHASADMYNAVDLAKVDDAGKLLSGDGRKLTSYYTYGAPVHAAAAGEVVAIVDGNPDTPIGVRGEFLAANSIAIRHAGGEFTLYAHLKPGSIAVSKGKRVKAGEVIGLVGNSGASASPHLHFCVYDIDGISLPFAFSAPPEKPADKPGDKPLAP